MKKSYDFRRAKRGAVVQPPAGKTRITIRIDDDVLAWFRKRVHEAGGGSYQAMMNRALREYMERDKEPLEATLRRVLRELLPGSDTKPQRPKAAKKARKKPSRP